MKLKYSIVIILLMLMNQKSYSQYWSAFNPEPNYEIHAMYVDSVSDLLYVGGTFTYLGGIHARGIATWNGSNWDTLLTGLDDFNSSYPGSPFSIVRYGNKIFIGGSFSTVGGIPSHWIATWDGFSWDSLPVSINEELIDMKVWNNELYVCGFFNSAGGIPVNSLAKWNGTSWSDVHSIPNLDGNGGYNSIFSMEMYQGNLYVGGIFQDSSGRKNITYWNGANWMPLGNGVQGSTVSINSMVVFQNELYVGGLFFQSDGNAGNSIMKWNGTNWYEVGGGLGGVSFPQIWKMKVVNNELYVVGFFNSVGNISASNIAKWDGQNWCSLEGVFDNTIGAIENYHDTIIVGGGFWKINGDSLNKIAKWIGGSHSDSCSTVGIKETYFTTNSLSIFPNPAFTIVYIKFEKTKVRTLRFKNILGEELLSKEINANEAVVDIIDFSPGIYFLSVQTAQGVMVKKFVKE